MLAIAVYLQSRALILYLYEQNDICNYFKDEIDAQIYKMANSTTIVGITATRNVKYSCNGVVMTMDLLPTNISWRGNQSLIFAPQEATTHPNQDATIPSHTWIFPSEYIFHLISVVYQIH